MHKAAFCFSPQIAGVRRTGETRSSPRQWHAAPDEGQRRDLGEGRSRRNGLLAVLPYPPHLPVGIFSPQEMRGEDSSPSAVRTLHAHVLAQLILPRRRVLRKLTAVNFGTVGMSV